jgi:hypothetical protein
MPTPPRKPSRRLPDDDPGYEVVENMPPRRARIVKADPIDDPGFEVVDDDPPPVKKKRPVVAVDEDDDDDRPVSRSRRDEDDEEPALPRKKKRKRPRFEDDEVAKPAGVAWWIVPCFLIGLGLAFSITGAVGIGSKARGATEAIGVGVILGVTLVQFVVSIPVSIIALVVGGKVFGIEYGSPLMAITNIAAIGSMMMGLDWVITWIGLWWSARFVITVLVAISLFMTLFQLDTWEVIVSIICIKVVTFLSYLAVFVVVIAAIMRGGIDGGNNFDDDDPDDRPTIKQKQKMDGNKNPAGNRGRGDPDWDPDDDD